MGISTLRAAESTPAFTVRTHSSGGSASKGRLPQLDSVRGLAALTVVFGHFIAQFPAAEISKGGSRLFFALKLSPAYFLIAAHEAVVLFFILSGIALHRMIAGRRTDSF